jgi:uracil-DNA glycosylase
MIEDLRKQIANHPSNRHYTEVGWLPLFSAASTAKIVIIGQAPGKKAQESGIVWNDASGERLMQWIGVSEDTFRNQNLFAHVPMDFYYPGKGPSGDLPPRRDFAELWHKKVLDLMPHIELTVLIGSYAQHYYLGNSRMKTLTETVRNFDTYAPLYFPLVHPSPLNFRWLNKNTWYEHDVIPHLQQRILHILDKQERSD